MYILYYKPSCPFCQKVLAFAQEAGISFDLRDIREEAVAAELMEHGGKVQVPYLVDEDAGRALYESDDIIGYLTLAHGVMG